VGNSKEVAIGMKETGKAGGWSIKWDIENVSRFDWPSKLNFWTSDCDVGLWQ
jgi:hypothetical protein